MERTDGRSAGQIRTVRCERGLLTRADGSAQWTQGGTCCLASVTGPTQCYASSKEDAERATVDVVFRPRSGLAGALERQYEALIRRACEAVIVAALHPRALIQVVLQVVSDDGGVLACALNAACAALLDAAVPLRTLCAAVSAAHTEDEGGLLLDPTAAEEAAAAATGTFAFLPLLAGGGDSKGDELQLLSSQTRGRLTTDQLLDMIEAAKQGADRLAAFMQQSARQAAPLAQ
ncbi:exosome complex exonuclease RRP46-like protein [Chlorella sorokiniana]|uniref:Exosome complex exonuclease RRP46-like protein n=1 Tax=Chlorella sorokiniana TaxID=3076 RepID=A0A2P6U4L3_CHLSO|nr:exosome complex exonuclease RRP46-like protein [Chlorella sorokiniana]|eukprot:PRW61249.1 exosome complex exonuclease RRP46-like protein [Chlorella sorokiniana]